MEKTKKNGLLSIGEISKLTGASIRSLRYYERLGLLKPAYTDPLSSYRYYSLDQSYLVRTIMYCIELDIPLKELRRFIDAAGIFDFRGFLAQGKKTARQKLARIERGLELIENIEDAIELAEKYKIGQIYEREVAKKYFLTELYEKPDAEIELYFRFEKIYSHLYSGEEAEYGLAEYGFLHICRGELTERYIFIELLKNEVPRFAANVMELPAGFYRCRQSEESQIESAREVFPDLGGGEGAFFAIETDIFTGKYKIDKPVCELRVIACGG
ncbi:MAG: MerR family transcriptional regulator [Spirochaetes bacterium]|nr:MerR family transcriptional regulator [Spirochaetota bacterium]